MSGSWDLSVELQTQTSLGTDELWLPGILMSPQLFTTSSHSHPLPLFLPLASLPAPTPRPALPLQLPLLPAFILAAQRQRGREELFIVLLFKMKGFYILMSTK